MSKKKLTEWFPADVKPARVGVYKTKFTALEGYSYWNGCEWTNQVDAKTRVRTAWTEGACQEKHWRGLAKNPKATQ